MVPQMSTSISPLAPASFPEMPPIDGVRFATAAAGIRYPGRTDVLLALLDEGTTVSGVFTRSKCPSAAVDWCRERIKGGRARADSLSKKQLSEIGKKAARARWGKRP